MMLARDRGIFRQLLRFNHGNGQNIPGHACTLTMLDPWQDTCSWSSWTHTRSGWKSRWSRVPLPLPPSPPFAQSLLLMAYLNCWCWTTDPCSRAPSLKTLFATMASDTPLQHHTIRQPMGWPSELCRLSSPSSRSHPTAPWKTDFPSSSSTTGSRLTPPPVLPQPNSSLDVDLAPVSI